MGGVQFIAVSCLVLFFSTVSAHPAKNEATKITNLTEGTKSMLVSEVHRSRRFIPFAYPNVFTEALADNCSDSSDDFPPFLTEDQRAQGGFVLCFLIGCYCFTLLAVVCDKYFLPSVERICEALNLTPDVAAATFMSVATSCPELFTNIIGTFVTQSDIGIGTIVGSSMFNALGVAAIGGLAAAKPIKLDWYPVTRDVLIYMMAVSLLVTITWDSVINWYEALVLFIVYFLYFLIMFQNRRISKFVKDLVGRRKNKVVDISGKNDSNLGNVKLEMSKGKEETNIARVSIVSAYGSYREDIYKPGYEDSKEYKEVLAEEEKRETAEKKKSLFRLPKGPWTQKLFFFYLWPIKFVLMCTIPNPKTHPSLFPISFAMCIIWIGTNSYIVSWMITIIGSVFNIPDAVLGLTFLSAGGSLPESISIAIMSRRGEGSMGVSNSLGANTMNILFSLGMPWFFKTMALMSTGGRQKSFIEIQSGSIEYTIMALIAVALILYITLYCNKFRLSKLTGGILLSVHVCCIVLAILSETVFFPSSQCG